MKIAITAICKNEETYIPKWLDAAKEADITVVVDTGSTDNSMQLLKDANCIVTQEIFEPFNFSKARNATLTLVPDDVDWIVTVDFDEILEEGWRKKLEDAIHNNPSCTAAWCRVNSLQEDGEWKEYKEGNKKFFKNKYYQWKNRIHEFLEPLDGESNEFRTDIWLHHHVNNHLKKDTWYTKLCIDDFEETGNTHALWFAIQHFVRNEKSFDVVKYCKLYLQHTKHEKMSFRMYVLQYLIMELFNTKEYNDMYYNMMTLLLEFGSLREVQNFIIDFSLKSGHVSFVMFIIDTFNRTDILDLRTHIIENLYLSLNNAKT